MNAQDLKLGFAGAATALAAIFALFALFSSGSAIAAEAATENVTIEDNTSSIDVEIEWSADATDANNANGEILVEDDAGMTVHSVTVSPDAGNTTTTTINVSDVGLDSGDYTVRIDATGDSTTPADYVVSSSVATATANGGGGALFGSLSNKQIGIGAVALIGAVLLATED